MKSQKLSWHMGFSCDKQQQHLHFSSSAMDIISLPIKDKGTFYMVSQSVSVICHYASNGPEAMAAWPVEYPFGCLVKSAWLLPGILRIEFTWSLWALPHSAIVGRIHVALMNSLWVATWLHALVDGLVMMPPIVHAPWLLDQRGKP